jgi:hypothetical protein
MTLVNDDQIKEIPRELSIKPRPMFVPSDGLISREIHLTALHCLPLNLPPCISEWGKSLVFGNIQQNVAVR